jgi:uncharacterized protein (TIGR00725 family)
VSRRRTVAILGGRPGNAGAAALRLAEAIGAELGRRGYGLVTGGDGGVAAAASRGCRSTGGDCLALLKWNSLDDAGEEITWSIPTSMDLARSNILNWSGDGMIAFEGRYGTLQEIGLALDTGRPLLLLGRNALLNVAALDVPTCVYVEDPQPADAAGLVDTLESLISANTTVPSRPGAALFTREPTDDTGIGLRRSTPGDAALFRNAFLDPAVLAWWSVDSAEGAAARLQHDRCLVIQERGRPVGFLEYHAEPHPDFDHIGVDIVIADAADRHREIGTRALRLFAEAVFAAGHHRITMVPSPDNTAAVKCYQKVGFRPVGIMRDYERHGGHWRDALLMDLIPADLAIDASGLP